jgi:predicted nucleotidyltransferase
LASLHVGKQTTVVRIARLEDALLCKLAVHREKDLKVLEQIIPKLKELGRIDWEYLSSLAKRFGLEREITALGRRS